MLLLNFGMNFPMCCTRNKIFTQICEIGDMARLALRQSNAGKISEDDWKQFIRDMEKKNNTSE